MRSFDLAPFYRSTVGFDQIADLMDRALANDGGQSTYPPYNIEKTNENAYRISIAVAGFAPDELTVEVKDRALIVSARKGEEQEERTFLHRGIATRAFERKFQLADHMLVEGATHRDGMLHIALRREIPEALKPRRIEIASDAGTVKDVVDAKAVN